MIMQLIRRWMRFFFHHLYHTFSWVYDFIAFLLSGGAWFKWGAFLMDYLNKADEILELGFGTGHLLDRLLQNGYSVVGLDESSSMVRISQKRLRKYQTIKMIRGDARNLPFKPVSFNKIIAAFPSEYILSEKCLNSVHEKLKPGGKLVIVFAVEITGNTITDRFYRVLYHITGQSRNTENSQQNHLLSKFNLFKQSELIDRKYKNHNILILIAEK